MENKIFDGLQKLGFTETAELELFKNDNQFVKEQREIKEKESIYNKTFECPVCGNVFKDKMIKTSSQRLLKTESDLKPVFEYFEPYKYDIVVCSKCGYAAMAKYFDKLLLSQISLIKQKIATKYKTVSYPKIYDIDTAIMRYKLALLNSTVKNGKSSEKALICLKIKWLYSDKINEIKNSKNCKTEILEELRKQEKLFTEQTLKGFLNTFSNETFPVFGLEENTVMYLIGELYRLLGFKDKASLWFSKVITTKNVNKRLKERARIQRDLIKKSNID